MEDPAVPEDSASTERPVTIVGRTGQSFIRRRWPEFAVELVLIVAGVLAALAIDGWAEERREQRTEAAYLELLRDDLAQIESQMQQYVDFETANLDTGAALYNTLDPANDARDPRAIQGLIAGLGARRTVQISSAAYTDLQSTGNLPTISNRDLRQQLIRFFAQSERTERVIEKNNTAFVDGIYFSFLLDAGITPGFSQANEASIAASEERVLTALGDDFSLPRDEILLRPATASSWDDIRRMILLRTRIASVGITLGEQTIEAVAEIRSAIEEELRNPI